jgi:predicted RNase H-like HicB family nuclease
VDQLVCGGAIRPFTDNAGMKFNLECEREDDGRWLAEVSQLPGVLAYGASANEAMAKAEVLALRVLAEQLEHGETLPLDISISIPVGA